MWGFRGWQRRLKISEKVLYMARPTAVVGIWDALGGDYGCRGAVNCGILILTEANYWRVVGGDIEGLGEDVA